MSRMSWIALYFVLYGALFLTGLGLIVLGVRKLWQRDDREECTCE